MKAAAGLAQCLLAAGDHDTARQIIDGLDDEAQAEPGRRRGARRAGAGGTSRGGPMAGSRPGGRGGRRQPDDKQARYDLAVALRGGPGRGRVRQPAVEIIQADRAWNEEAARKQLVKIFEALGPDRPS